MIAHHLDDKSHDCKQKKLPSRLHPIGIKIFFRKKHEETQSAFVSIHQTDMTSFLEDGRGVKWLCNQPKSYPYPNCNPN